MKTLIIIPTYNEADNIAGLIKQIFTLRVDADILVVDDNSPDGTAETVKGCQKNCPRLFLLERPGKNGLGRAYLAGFAWAQARGYETAVQMDADFSHAPRYLPDLLQLLVDHDLAIGSRYVAGGGVVNWPWWRRLISRGGSWYARLILGLKIRDLTGGFNAWRLTALEKINLDSVTANGYSFQIELKAKAARQGLTIKEFPIIFAERRAGQSKLKGEVVWEAVWRVWQLKFAGASFEFWPLALLLALTAFVYRQTFFNTFTYWDDYFQIFSNPLVRELTWINAVKLFASYSVYLGMYQPLASLALALEHYFFNSQAGGYHAVSLLLHLINVGAVYCLIKLLTQKRTVAWLTAALFALQPLQVEAVAWISAQSTLLCSLGYLTALIAYWFYLKKGRWPYLAATFILFAVALSAKAAAVTLPVVLLLLDFAARRRWRLKNLWEKIPFFLLAAAGGAAAIFIRIGSHLDLVSQPLTVWEKFLVISHSLVTYLIKTILPLNLAAFYPWPEKINGLLPWTFYAAPLVLAALAIIIWRSENNRRLLILLTAFFLLTVAPTLKIISSTTPIMADRYLYLPALAVWLGLALVWEKIIATTKRKKLFFAGTALYLLLLAALTSQWVAVWQNDISRWGDVIAKFPRSAAAYGNRAQTKATVGDDAGALADWQTAVRIAPQDAPSYNNIGWLLTERLGQPRAALIYFDRAIELDPSQTLPFFNKANALAALNDSDNAIKNFNLALKLDPGLGSAYYYRGLTRQKLKQLPAACADWRQAQQLGVTAAAAVLNAACQNYE